MLQTIRNLLGSGRIWRLAAFGLVLAVALAPWCRNRGYVRHFFDYGVVIGGVGRIEQGEKPYTGFITPIQASWYAFNWAAEKIGGGTYQAMTLAGAASIVIAMLVLSAMLARRWPWWAALSVAGALTCATAAQHTLLWYNPWGVIWLAVVAWSGALAPVLRRSHLGWHLLMALGLFLGGLNKVNMQLMALGLAAGWAVRAAIIGQSGWGRVIATGGFIVLTGAVLPVLAEMAWTGASFALWWHNVIAQLGAGRAGMVLDALHWKFLLEPCHHYYQPLRLPQVGLLAFIVASITATAIWRQQRGPGHWLDRVLAGICVLIALLGGLILFSTNIDIAYIALAGCFALLVALWLGFGVPARGVWFWAGVIVPAWIMGAVAWESAWQGVRSQFGYSQAPRSEYVAADQAGPAFAYFKGTRVPPDVFGGMRSTGEWQAAMSPEQRQNVIYGAGAEWAAHLWPVAHTPQLPVYIMGGWQFGPEVYASIRAAVNSPQSKAIMVAHAQDHWTPELTTALKFRYIRRTLGEVYTYYYRPKGGGVSAVPLDFREAFGGSVDSRMLTSDGMFFERKTDSGQMFIGTSHGRETMRIDATSNRVQGQVIVKRLDMADRRAMAADFTLYAEGEAGERFPRWQQRVTLPEGQDDVVVDYAIDSSGLLTRYFVDIPPEFTDKIAAGWRAPTIFHSNLEGPANPRWLYPEDLTISMLSAKEIAAVLPADRMWTPHTIMVRGGQVVGNELEFANGGEIWIHVDGYVTAFSGQATLIDPRAMGAGPYVHGMWMKGARLESYTRLEINNSTRTVPFQSWTAEPNGWIIVGINPVHGAPIIRVRIDQLVHRP